MAEAGNTRAHAEKSQAATSSRTRQESQGPASTGVANDILNLQQSAGNRAVGQLLARAAQESSQRLDESVRVPIEQSLGANLDRVRVHSGASSNAAAESLGARAYTIGSDVYLGSDAQHLSPQKRNQLLAHEAVHTVQQGGRPVAIQGKMEVSHPGDSAEVEAENISRTIMTAQRVPRPSLALGLRDQLRATPIARTIVSRVAAPLVQRDLKRDYPVNEGTFTLDLKTESHPVPATGPTATSKRNGMSGTVKFKANAKAPDADKIRIMQVLRNEDLTTGKEYVWTSGEEARNKIQSPGGTGAGDPGFHVDVLHAKRTPRTAKTDPAVSPYYIDDYLALGDPNNKDGSKKGKTITEASIWDYPGSFGNRRFTFETLAKDPATGHVFGTVMWGFTISDASKGTVEKEIASGRNVTLRSTNLAIEAFDKYYKNPGTSGAP
jgi:hypothetical protein